MPTATPRPRPSAQLPGDHALLRAVDLDRIPWFEAIRHRHHTAVHAYALTCVAVPELAETLSAYAFSRLRDQVSRGSRAATGLHGTCLRVNLLSSVRREAVEVDPRQMSPGFRRWVSEGGLWSMDDDYGLSQSYQRLPAVDRCLIWHTLVEHESAAAVADVTGLPRAQLPDRYRSALTALRRAQAAAHLHQTAHVNCRLHGGVDVLISAYLPLHGDAHAHLLDCAACRTLRTRLNLLRSRLAYELPQRLLGWWPGEEYRGHKSAMPGTAPPRPSSTAACCTAPTGAGAADVKPSHAARHCSAARMESRNRSTWRRLAACVAWPTWLTVLRRPLNLWSFGPLWSPLHTHLARCIQAAQDHNWGMLKDSAGQLAAAAARLDAGQIRPDQAS